MKARVRWRTKPKSSRRSQRTPGPAVRATGTKRPDWSCGRRLGLGELGNGRNLRLCFHAAPRSARCSNDAAPLSRSVGSQDRVVARVRRGGHVRPRLAVFRPRYHSCHCRGRRCGRGRGNHQIIPLFRARTALGSAVAALIDNGASQPQKIRPGQAEPGRSGAVRSTRGGKLDSQIKMAMSFGLMRPPFDSTRLVICALPDEVAGEIKPAAIPAEAHTAKLLPKPLPPAGPITRTPTSRGHDARSRLTGRPRFARKGWQQRAPTAVYSFNSVSSDLSRATSRTVGSSEAGCRWYAHICDRGVIERKSH